MSTPLPAPTSLRPDPLMAPVQEVLDAYGRAHDSDLWFWQRISGEWVLAAGTSPPATATPGACTAPVPNSTGPESRIEISVRGGVEPKRATEFLAVVLANVLKYQSDMRFFGGEIAERYEEITLLYTISEILGSVISLEEAARTILGEVVDTMAVKRAALWVHEPELDSLQLVAAVGGEGFAGPISVADETSITAAVFRDRRAMILETSDEYPRDSLDFGPANRESFLSVPVSYTPPHGQARTIGVINLIGRRVEEGFSAGDRKLIAAIASQIGAAVENSRLVAESLRRERVDREMELAHHLQLKLLPSAEQFRDRADLAARCAPADSVGGDFYHLFRLPGGRFGVVIGDVSSHGFAAALIMALTMSAVAIHASEGDAPAEVLRRAHRALIDELESTEMYLTLFYAVIDPTARRLSYANAGHPHAFVVSRDGDARRLAVTNPPFGLVHLDDYAEESIDWQPRNDLLFLFTDGLSDAIGQATGEKRLVEQVCRYRDRPLDELLQSLFEIEPHEEGIPADDRTAVLVRV
jgi:sigma-B regulation protein RsbU (phosphoserine phosphatase)